MVNDSSDEQEDVHHQDSDCNGKGFHVKNKLDAGHADCNKEQQSVKTFRRGRIILSGGEIQRKLATVKELTWMKHGLTARRRPMEEMRSPNTAGRKVLEPETAGMLWKREYQDTLISTGWLKRSSREERQDLSDHNMRWSKLGAAKARCVPS